LFFPHAVPEFILAMAIWGVYYEFLVFSKAYFIEAFIKMDRHAMAWGILNTFRSITMFVSPIFVPILLDRGVEQPLIATFTFLFLGMIGILIFHKLFPHKDRDVVKEVVVKRTSALKELYIWRSLIKRIWPIFLFMFTLFVLEATFFSVGVLASEDLRQISQWGTFLIPAYTLPNLFTGFFIQKLGISLGKKRLAFGCGAVGGVLLFVATLLESHPLLLILTIFTSAIFSSVSYPAILAATQDYVTRLGEFGGEMVGLQNASSSLGYVIGPILAGWAGMQFGNIHAVGLIGLLLLGVSMLNLIIVPRKIHLPQKELQNIVTQ
jgi:MFS family permease